MLARRCHAAPDGGRLVGGTDGKTYIIAFEYYKKIGRRVTNGQSRLIIERHAGRRKTISILVGRNGDVTVRTPLRTPAREIDAFLSQKAGWIERKTAEARARRRERHFITGETVPFLGREIPLVVETGLSRRVARARFLNGSLSVTVPYEIAAAGDAPSAERAVWVQRSLSLWYRPRARNRLEQMAADLAAANGYSPETVRIKALRSSWGLCRGNHISLNWRLIMAPETLIEYVICHELCHLRHKGHDATYWTSVEALVPDYRERRKALKGLDCDWL